MDIVRHPQKNNFDRLPDDIVLSIFNQLWEARWLGRCSMVCKRFSSLVPHINNVSVKPAGYIFSWSKQKEATAAIFDYLVGLKDLMYLHIEEDFFCDLDSWPPLLKWKFNFDTNVRSFTFLMASFLLRVELPLAQDEEDEEEDGEEIQNATNIRQEEELLRVNMAVGCLKDACMKLNIVLDMIGKHQMLQSITLTDIMNQGKIVVSGYQIAELRHLERAKLSMPKVDPGIFKCCHLPSLHLPKSKFVMVRPTLVYIRCVNPSCDNEGDDVIDGDMLAGSFDEDEGEVFSEAVKEILAKHKNKMSTERVTEEVDVVAAAAQNQ